MNYLRAEGFHTTNVELSLGSNSCRKAWTIRGNTKSLSSLLLLNYHFMKIAWKSLLAGVALQGQTATAKLAAMHSLGLLQPFQSADSKVPKYLQQRTWVVQSLCVSSGQEREQLKVRSCLTLSSGPEAIIQKHLLSSSSPGSSQGLFLRKVCSLFLVKLQRAVCVFL